MCGTYKWFIVFTTKIPHVYFGIWFAVFLYVTFERRQYFFYLEPYLSNNQLYVSKTSGCVSFLNCYIVSIDNMIQCHIPVDVQ